MRLYAPGKPPFDDGTARLFKQRSVANVVKLACAGTFTLWLFVSPAAFAGQERAQTPDISIVPKPINDTMDTMTIRNPKKNVPGEQKAEEPKDTCLLPPLTFVRSPVVAATALSVPAKAKKEYLASCEALRERKTDRAEKHLQKAVQIYPKYSAAWVTLGQVFMLQNHADTARSACTQASTVEPNYLPAYLCLAGLAAQEKGWTVVLQLTSQALAIDPMASALAYELNASAHLRMNHLDEAEKSAQRALELDKNNSGPRVHFLLAQIYEAKNDRGNEVLQLQEYLKFAGNSEDAARIKLFLEQLEKPPFAAANITAQPTQGSLSALAVDEHPGSTALTAPAVAGESSAVPEEPDADDNAPQACNLDDVLPQVQRKVQEFVDNVQKFTATEMLVYEALNGAGRVAREEHAKYDYLVSIDESIAGILAVNEFQNSHSSSGAFHPEVVTKGLPALLLIFHPYYAGDFSMRCEGLKIVKGEPAWQIRFRQRTDKPSRIRSYKMGAGGPAYEVNLQGRAWFMADNYQIIKLEADLVKAIPEIQLTVDHTSAEYGPVHFRSRGIEIWLPQTADLVSERKGKRLHERITFSDYLLFAIDNKEEIAAPKKREWLTGLELCGSRTWCDGSHLASGDAARLAPALLMPD